MSARHRQHKRKLWAAQQELAEREVDLVSFVRVINAMPGLAAPAVLECRDAVWQECNRLREVIADLERTVPA